jgi:hemoglobin
VESVYEAAGGSQGLLRLAQAMDDVGLPSAGPLRQVLHAYFEWATTNSMFRFHRSADDVPEGMSIPRWSWDGLQP